MRAQLLGAHFTNETEVLSSPRGLRSHSWIQVQVGSGSPTLPSKPLPGPQSPCLSNGHGRDSQGWEDMETQCVAVHSTVGHSKVGHSQQRP